MKSFITIPIIAALASSVASAPAPADYTPPGGWRSVDYSKFDWSKVDWPRVDYNKVDWSKMHDGQRGPHQWLSAAKTFTSTYSVAATPDQVVNGTGAATVFTGGLKGCKGTFNYGIIASTNTICYHIELYGFQGNYQSLAKTATHIHQAAKGLNGPPRLAFPNPVAVNANVPQGKRLSVGCMTGPFTTGIITNGVDTGAGFQVSQIESDPKSFFTDVHSSLAVPGAVRGQLA